jgi:transketolase
MNIRDSGMKKIKKNCTSIEGNGEIKIEKKCGGQMITRDNVLTELVPHFKKDNRFYLLISDSGFGKTEEIKKLFPPRVFNLGIMEQATVGIASGMAQSGLIPVIYSIAAFLVYRSLEQIRVDIVMRNQNVKLIGNGSGDYFKFLDDCHWMKDDDRKLMDIIGMPAYDGSQFKEWIESEKAGYLIC